MCVFFLLFNLILLIMVDGNLHLKHVLLVTVMPTDRISLGQIKHSCAYGDVSAMSIGPRCEKICFQIMHKAHRLLSYRNKLKC